MGAQIKRVTSNNTIDELTVVHVLLGWLNVECSSQICNRKKVIHRRPHKKNQQACYLQPFDNTMIKTIFQIVVLLTVATGLAQGAPVISDMQPSNGSSVTAPTGSVTLSAIITDSSSDIKEAKINMEADGKQTVKNKKMSLKSGRWVYDVTKLTSGVQYCFNILAKNKKKDEKESAWSCFYIGTQGNDST